MSPDAEAPRTTACDHDFEHDGGPCANCDQRPEAVIDALEVQVAALRTLLAERSREVHDEALHPNGRWEECGARPCRDDRAALAATKENAHGG